MPPEGLLLPNTGSLFHLLIYWVDVLLKQSWIFTKWPFTLGEMVVLNSGGINRRGWATGTWGMFRHEGCIFLPLRKIRNTGKPKGSHSLSRDALKQTNGVFYCSYDRLMHKYLLQLMDIPSVQRVFHQDKAIEALIDRTHAPVQQVKQPPAAVSSQSDTTMRPNSTIHLIQLPLSWVIHPHGPFPPTSTFRKLL